METHDVFAQMKADMETDEVFAQMTLQPVSDVSIYTFIQHFPFSFLLFTNLANLLNLVFVAREGPLSSTRYRHSKSTTDRVLL